MVCSADLNQLGSVLMLRRAYCRITAFCPQILPFRLPAPWRCRQLAHPYRGKCVADSSEESVWPVHGFGAARVI
ncbi:hypothetical protein [Prevotella nigrescens]|uniref:hypothetical protein n=1 Tax=Prevotella nigrescens TaxID=28133 RepID=UPI00288BE9F2|nr:hypothetical protein [Prevotella nigrescens]